MFRNAVIFPLNFPPARKSQRKIVPNRWRRLSTALVALAVLCWTGTSRAVLLWSDLGATQVHETGAGEDILGGVLKRDDSSTDTLYFKFHVDPLSDATTEEYFAAFQLFEGNHERLAVGNALKAWAYSAFATGESGRTNTEAEYFDLNSSKPERPGIGTNSTYELPHWGIERTIVFKVQYVAGGDDLVTVWLEPNLRPDATEKDQPEGLTTHFEANASFDQIRIRHGGGGDGWIFSEMAIATSFSDFANTGESESGGDKPFSFRSWQREQGLPENYVRALAQTQDGYLWVGSDEGVSRFDGVNFFSLGLQEKFQSGPVRVLFGDSRGGLWIGSVDAGLSYWEGDKLSTYTIRDGLPSDSITALAEDASGRLWVGTQGGLAVLVNGRFTTVSGSSMFSGKPVTTLYRDRQGVMWAGATGVGIFSFARDKFTQLQDPAVDSLLQYPHCLLIDAKGRIWLGAGDAFVLCRDGNQWMRFGMPRHLAAHYIDALAEGSDDTVWAGSVGEGLFEFKGGKLAAINASSGLSDNMIEALMTDREGQLWVGTHGGLDRICPRKVSVHSHDEGLDYGEVQGVAEISPSVTWVAQPSGVYQWDGERFRRLFLVGPPPQAQAVSSLLAAPNGGCWLAGNAGLLYFRNPGSAERNPGVPALTNLNVSALGQNPATGEIWAGTRDGGLWHQLEHTWQAQTNFPGGHGVTGILTDANGKLWVGTEGDGLYRLDGPAFARCEKVHGLPSSWIRTLYQDAENTLWIGTGGGGLCRMQNGEIATFTKREGLPDNTISQILEDDDGNLWLGGNRGIARVKKRDLADLAAHKIPAIYPQIYGRADGMLSEECAGGFCPAGLKTKAGALWFSTLKGIVVIDPRHLINSPAPTVALQQTLVDGVPETPVFGRAGEGISVSRNSEPSSTESLLVAPGKHTLEFRYTGLSFDAPERVRFRYRLEGLDPDWVEAGTRRAALYSFVPPGTYHFRVIACNGDGVWNENGSGLTLKVLSYFWQTWWFLGGTALTSAVMGVGAVRVVVKRRLQQRLQRLELDRALERERTRIAQDLHDIMGAKLCRISFMSEDARRSPAIPTDLQQQIRSISDDSREVLRSLDEVVWAINPEKDSLEHLVSYVAQYAQDYLRKTGIECELEIPAQLPAQPLTSQSRHHLFLAFHEALTNILKHSGATRAHVAVTCRANAFEIVVADNGNGFDLAQSESNTSGSSAGFGNGLTNMRRRLTEIGGSFRIESQPGQGTTIRFGLLLNVPLH